MAHLWSSGLVSRIVFPVSLVLGVAFVVQYTWYSPWWRDPVGRTVVAMDISVFLAVLFPTIRRFVILTRFWTSFLTWGDIVAVAMVAAILAWRIVVWHRIQDKFRKHK